MPLRGQRRLLVLLAALLLAIGAALLAARRGRATPEVAPGETFPAGRWHTRPAAGAAAAADRARLLSLPYVAGRRTASGEEGVVRWVRGRAADGENLYVSGHAPEARLVALDGSLRHRWRLGYGEFAPGSPVPSDLAYWRRAAPAPRGGLFALFQGGGLARLDDRSRLLWAVRAATFNDLWPLPDGGVLVLTKEARVVPALDPGREVLEDRVEEYGPDGALRRRVSILGALLDSPFRTLLDPLPAGPDLLHANTIEVIAGHCADRWPAARAGLWLVSLREIDTIALVDPDRGVAVWAQRGPWRAQHDSTLLPGCSLLLFDNRGREGRSRAIEWDPVAGAVTWEFAGEPGEPLDSPEAGAVQRLANGNTLVVESERGRALEVTPAGEIVWELASPHRAGRGGELVATLFDVVRLPPLPAPPAGGAAREGP